MSGTIVCVREVDCSRVREESAPFVDLSYIVADAQANTTFVLELQRPRLISLFSIRLRTFLENSEKSPRVLPPFPPAPQSARFPSPFHTPPSSDPSSHPFAPPRQDVIASHSDKFQMYFVSPTAQKGLPRISWHIKNERADSPAPIPSPPALPPASSSDRGATVGGESPPTKDSPSTTRTQRSLEPVLTHIVY